MLYFETTVSDVMLAFDYETEIILITSRAKVRRIVGFFTWHRTDAFLEQAEIDRVRIFALNNNIKLTDVTTVVV